MFSFFKKKDPICPIDEKEAIWVNTKLTLINKRLFKWATRPLVLPNEEYFPFEFCQKEEDAQKVLDTIGKIIRVRFDKVKLEFYDEGTLNLGGGMQTAKDSLKSSAGKFYYLDNVISIEKSQLKNPEKLVATMIHEVCHYIMHNKYARYHWGEEEELLTDLIAIAYGFGIFMGKAKQSFQQNNQGWSWSTQGYLSLPVIAYTLAYIQFEKGEQALKPNWHKNIQPSFKRFYIKSMRYLIHQSTI